MLSAFLCFSVLLRSAVSGDIGVIVRDDKNQVTYRGTSHDGIETFQNVRFAHDTSGKRRFAPPEPYLPPPGSEIDATSPGPACPQVKDAMPPFFAETDEISEDCLNLRISRPSGTTPSSKLPVVVWVHGGGVVKGSAYDPHFEPDKLLSLSQSIGKPIIYVAIQYRVTAFGFTSLPILRERKSLNVGMRDQRAGFQWVKDNIEAFGGDPLRITSFGLSAGGTFTSLHLVSFGGREGVPFTQGWAMSGPPGTALNISGDVATSHTLAVAKSLGCAMEDGEQQLQCLRDVPMEKLLSTAMEYSVANHPPAGLFTFIPTLDGDFFPDRPTALYRNGNFVKGIPLVFGWTQDDGAMNVGPAPLIQSAEDMAPGIRKFARLLTDDEIDTFLKLYDEDTFAEDVRLYEAAKASGDPDVSVHYFRLSRILRDLLFTCSSIDFGYEMSTRSKKIDAGYKGVYLYNLNQSMLTPLWKGAGMPYVGVSHGSDSNYIFNGVFPEGEISTEDLKLSNDFATTFINFAYTGQPHQTGSEDLEDWVEAFEGAERQTPGHHLSSVNIHVVGGPYGSGPTHLHVDEGKLEDAFERIQKITNEQEVLPGVKVEAMSSPQVRLRKASMSREHILDRCAFISGLSERLEI